MKKSNHTLAILLLTVLLAAVFTPAMAAEQYIQYNGTKYSSLNDLMTKVDFTAVTDVTLYISGTIEMDANDSAVCTDSYKSFSLPNNVKTLSFIGVGEDATLQLKSCESSTFGKQGGIWFRNGNPQIETISFQGLTISHDKTENKFVYDYARRASGWFVEGPTDQLQVNYTNCTFPQMVLVYNDTTFTNCKFTSSVSGKYALYIEGKGSVDVTVEGSTFEGYRAIKLDATNTGATQNINVESNVFTSITEKAAIEADVPTLTLAVEENRFIDTTPLKDSRNTSGLTSEQITQNNHFGPISAAPEVSAPSYSAPQTGDNTPILLLLSLMMLSACVLAASKRRSA